MGFLFQRLLFNSLIEQAITAEEEAYLFYKDLQAELPLLTRVTLAVSYTLRDHLLIIVIVLGVALAILRQWLKTSRGRLAVDRLKLKLPFLGRIAHSFAVSEYCRALSTLVEGGLPVVLSQTFRSMIHSRMKVGMAKYDTAYTDRDVLLFEPDRHDSKMFFTNVFSYASRENVCQHAYRTTRRDLLARRRDLEPILRRHGIRLDLDVLRDPARHFTAALGGTEGERELGVYKNPVTNRLSRALDRLEGALKL